MIGAVVCAQVLGVEEAGWKYHPLANGARALINAKAKKSAPVAVEAAAPAQPKAVKVDAAKRKELETAFEAAYPGCYLGGDRSAPSNKLIARCLDMVESGKDWPGRYIEPALCTSVSMEEEESRKKAEKTEKVHPPLMSRIGQFVCVALACFVQEKEKLKQQAKAFAAGWCPVTWSDDEEDLTNFQGGPFRLEFVLDIRNKAMALAKLSHMKALSMYSDALFEYATCTMVPDGYRRPSCAEIIAADKAALTEAFRMRGKGQGNLQTCLVHVSKPGGLMQSLLQPKPVAEKRLNSSERGSSQAGVVLFLVFVKCALFSCLLVLVQVSKPKKQHDGGSWNGSSAKDSWQSWSGTPVPLCACEFSHECWAWASGDKQSWKKQKRR